ncbi:MAG: hypothetical protein ACFFD6_03485 [Candidatus Thorarchaeota archaeon]
MTDPGLSYNRNGVEVWIENATLTARGFDLTLNVFVTINATESVFVLAVNLLLSLDNMSHTVGQTHVYATELNMADTDHFILTGSIGDPIPFSLHRDEILFVWVEMEYSAGETWPGGRPALSRSSSVALEAPIEYHAPLIVPDILVQLSVILISTAGALGLIFLAFRRKVPHSVSRQPSGEKDAHFIRAGHQR